MRELTAEQVHLFVQNVMLGILKTAWLCLHIPSGQTLDSGGNDGRGPSILSASARMPIATGVLATGIFVADTVTRVDIVFAVLYSAVVLLSARFCRSLGVALVAPGCATLTILSYVTMN